MYFRTISHQFFLVVILIFVSVLANVQGTLFMQKLIDDYITPFLLTDHPNFAPLAKAIGQVAVFYAVGVVSAIYLQSDHGIHYTGNSS